MTKQVVAQTLFSKSCVRRDLMVFFEENTCDVNSPVFMLYNINVVTRESVLRFEIHISPRTNEKGRNATHDLNPVLCWLSNTQSDAVTSPSARTLPPSAA